MKRKFATFTIYTNLKEPVTMDNFYKDSISIYDTKDNLIEVIRKGELSFSLAQDLIHGDENKVKTAIKTIINNRLYWIDRLKELI